MTRQQFSTRGSAVLGGQLSTVDAASTSYAPRSGDYHFNTSRGGAGRLLLGSPNVAVGARSAGAGGCGQGRAWSRPLVFCSVTASGASNGGLPVGPSSGGRSDSSGNGSGGSNGTGRKGGQRGASGPDGGVSGAEGSGSCSLERLPVAIKKGDQLLPYVWDGKRISAMDEAALAEEDVNKGRLRNWVLGLQRRLHEAFLPDPRDVTPDYWEWLRWRLSQRFFSSTMQNFSFSALLMATGLGAKKAFAASAAINWLLKDGVSRIVRMTVSTSFGQTFDADLKRMRFITSLIFTGCMAGEFATPFWPQHFVALASVSSVGRAVGLSAFVATQPAFQAALATGGNLADLTSKNQAQHMVMDMLALGVSAGLTWLCRGMPRGGLLLPAVMYPICAAGDLTCIWHELKAVQLRTLNRERAEMLIERWMRRGGAVPDAAEISAAESLVCASDVWSGCLPVTITALDKIVPRDPALLRRLLADYAGEQYVLTVSPAVAAAAAGAGAADGAHGAGGRQEHTSSNSNSSGAGGGGGAGAGGAGQAGPLSWLPWVGGSAGAGGSGAGGGTGAPRVLVSLSDRAAPADITKALLHAAYLRKALLEHLERHAPAAQSPHHHKQPHHHAHNHHNSQQQNHNHPHSGHSSSSSSSSGSQHGHLQPLLTGHLSDSSSSSSSSSSLSSAGGSHEARLLGKLHEVGSSNNSGSISSGGVTGHTHDHTHWDPHRHTYYHHSHYHTHASSSAGSSAATAAVPHTASLSLSRTHNNNGGTGSSSVAGGGGSSSHEAVAAAAAAGDRDHHEVTQHMRVRQAEAGAGVAAPPPLPRLTWRGEVAARLDADTWAQLIRSSRQEAARNLPRLLQQAEQAGWKLQPFMLNTAERVQFVRL